MPEDDPKKRNAPYRTPEDTEPEDDQDDDLTMKAIAAWAGPSYRKPQRGRLERDEPETV